MTLTGAGLNFQVSLIVFKLDGVEALLQVCDTGVTFSSQVSQVFVHQPGNIGYDDFYGKFSSPKGMLLEFCCCCCCCLLFFFCSD